MSYLTAYRSQSAKYGGDGVKAFKPPPAPYKPATRPPFANDNVPRPANDNLARVGGLGSWSRRGRLIIRRNPWLNALEFGLDLWRLQNNNNSLGQVSQMSGWTLQTVCAGGGPTHYNGSIGTGPWSSTPCFGSFLDSTAVPINAPFPFSWGRIRFERLTGTYSSGSPLYGTISYYHRPARVAAGTRLFRQAQRTPAPRPVLEPALLPILMPMPLPLPVPLALVPHRLNDPLGSQRNNGDKRPRITPRQPPPKDTKEKKVRALSGLVGLIQSGGHVLTEALDLLEALHDALPKDYQAKAVFKGGKWWNATPQAKAEAIYNNFDKMNLNDAVKNLIANEIGDRILGRANARVDQALNRTPIGRITRGVAF